MAQVLAAFPRSVPVVSPRLQVEVVATGSLGRRIIAALEAGGIGIDDEEPDGPPVRIVAENLARPVLVGPLRKRLAAGEDARIVVVSPDCTPLAARRAIRAGAASVVLESDLEGTLAPAVRAVAAGLSAVPVPLQNAADRPELSHREREVLRLAISGNTNSEIARGMFLAQSTVKSHLSSAYRKLGAASRKEATSLVLDPDEGLLEIVFGTHLNGNRSGFPRRQQVAK
jgi:DNA-binding NarL/FixJ family response regulator